MSRRRHQPPSHPDASFSNSHDMAHACESLPPSVLGVLEIAWKLEQQAYAKRFARLLESDRKPKPVTLPKLKFME